MTFTLSPLPYTANALEPIIDQKTVELHYGKHHQTYCDKLNAGITGTEYENQSLEQLVSQTNTLPDNLKTIVRNHGGGLLNHNIYRAAMIPGGSAPSDTLKASIEQAFGSRDEFQKQFVTNATNLFGSGRTRLEKDGDTLKITNYPNQENPLMYGKTPLLGLDVREHAYYLNYQNRRAEYINGWWTLINRSAVEHMM